MTVVRASPSPAVLATCSPLCPSTYPGYSKIKDSGTSESIVTHGPYKRDVHANHDRMLGDYHGTFQVLTDGDERQKAAIREKELEA